MFYSHSDPKIMPQPSLNGQVGDISLHCLRELGRTIEIYEEG
jgi:hypothetical protein